MPRKIKKTKGETTSEEFFPVEKGDIKYSVEKEEKPDVISVRTSVEKHYKGPQQEKTKSISTRKKRFSKGKQFFKKNTGNKADSNFKKSKLSKSFKPFTPPTISLKPNSYELIITEKPQAALKIASALGNSTKRNVGTIPYYEVSRDSKRIIVACAVGHLFTLHQKNQGSSVPIFDISWEPNYKVRKNDFTKKYLDVILKLAKDAGSITVATDYDVEGEVIGFNIVRFLCGQKDANRMKFSTLTEKELNDSYENKSAHLNWGQAIAGETRHHLDWFYGINLSRALMNAIKSVGKFKIMSIGRVQGPALNLIVKKEKEIKAFKPEPYWQVFITVKNSHTLELKHNKDIFKKEELKKFDNLKGKTVQAITKKTQQELPPGEPFNLTTLQTEAYKFYGISPSQTLRVAQSLYLAGLISYPRTSSQKLPASIGYREILNRLAKEYGVENHITRTYPVEGKKTDPAHPSIYPTGQKQILSGEEEKIYNLIVKRFLSLFADNAIIDKKKVSVEVNGLEFSALGSEVNKKGWMAIYPNKMKELQIPDLNGKVKIINMKVEEKETQPPKRYSQASIISELEKRNLGTKATRSSILETLYDRGYVKERSIEATPLGISLIDTLKKYSPIIIDENLTRSFETQMESIVEAKKDPFEKEKIIIEKAKKTIQVIAEDFEKNNEKIGSELAKANEEFRQELREENKLNQCPVCNKGTLRITFSKKTRRSFVACDAYPNCKNTYSLPPNGLIKKTEKLCPECNFPMLMRISKGKRPWEFCFNKECPTNKERIEKYREKNEG